MSRAALGVLAAMSLTSALVVGAPAPAPAAPSGSSCTEIDKVDTESKPATEPSDPLASLQIAEAHEVVERRTSKGVEPGSGVVVAVLDSGVADPPIDVDGRLRDGELVYYHGTAMAGLIAGEPQEGVGIVGIAPGARIFDARFYDSDNDDDGITPTEDTLVDGLEALLPEVGTDPGEVGIVTIAIAVEDSSPALESAIRDVTDAGAIVVASSGNREPDTATDLGEGDGGEEGSGDAEAYEFGEDVTRYPAGYSTTNTRVVSVGTTIDATEDPDSPPGLLSSSIDVVVPTYGAVSYGINGSTCSFAASSTSVAAAEVAGVLALLQAAYPQDTPEQSIARLEVTATGGSAAGSGVADTYRGRGIVQPVEALTRPLRPDEDGVVQPGVQPPPAVAPAVLPPSQPDVLRSTRRDAVWWGLFGGGALVVALLLRPVLSRRRTT